MASSRQTGIIIFKGAKGKKEGKPWRWAFMSRGEVKALSANTFARPAQAKTSAAAVAKALGGATITVREGKDK